MKAGTLRNVGVECRGVEGRREGNGTERANGECRQKEKLNNKIHLFLLGRFGLGPGSDIPRASPSRGEEFSFLGAKWEVGFGLVPHFALGPIANIPDPTSSGGDSLMLGMSDMDGWLDVRGSKVRNVGVSTPSRRTSGRLTAHSQVEQNCQQPHMGGLGARTVAHGRESSGTASIPSPG